MAVAHLINAEEYLHSSFEYDAEFVEGRIVQRSIPTIPHSIMQTFLIWVLYGLGRELGFRVLTEQRIRTKTDPSRYRIPDVCVVDIVPEGGILTKPPTLCIEILSPDDSVIELRIKIDEYLDFSVQYVWVIDPVARTGEIYTRSGIERVRDGKFRAGVILVDLNELEP